MGYRASYYNVLYLVMGQPLVMGQYFDFQKSIKIYHHQHTIALWNLIVRGLNVLPLVIIYKKKNWENKIYYTVETQKW